MASAFEIVSDGATFSGTAKDVDAVGPWIIMPATAECTSWLVSIVSEFESTLRGLDAMARLLRVASALQGRYSCTKEGESDEQNKGTTQVRGG